MEFKLSDMLDNYFRSYILVLVVMILTLSVGLYAVYGLYENEYVSKTTIMLGYNKGESASFDIYLNQSILKNYEELAVSDIALLEVKEQTKLDYSISQLKNIITINSVDGTEYLVIEATTNNKYDCAKISYSVYEVLSKEVERIFGLSNIHLVDTSSKGTLKYNKHLFAVVVIVGAIALSFLASIIKFFLFPNLVKKNKIKKVKKIENEKKNIIKTEPTKKVVKKVVVKSEPIKKVIKKETVESETPKKVVKKEAVESKPTKKVVKKETVELEPSKKILKKESTKEDATKKVIKKTTNSTNKTVSKEDNSVKTKKDSSNKEKKIIKK